MSTRFMQRILAALFGILILVWALPAPALDSPADRLQSWESTLTSIERELADDPDLAEYRHGEILQVISALDADARALVAAEQQRTQPVRNQLNQLGPPPSEGAPPEDRDIAATRARLSAELGKSQARVKRAELAMTRARAIQDEIGQREQLMTQRKLAVQGPMPWSPQTWRDALSETDVIYKKVQPSMVQWWNSLEIAEKGWVAIAIGVGIVILAGILAFPVRRWVLAKWGPRAEVTSPSYTWRMIAAVAGTVARILLPTLAIIALYIVFVITLPQQYDSAFPIFVLASGGSLILFFVVSGLTVACLSPDLPAWRIVPVPEKAAAMLGHRVVTGAGLLLLLSIAHNAVSSPAKLNPSDEFASIIALFASIIAVTVFLPCLRAKYWVSDTHFKSRLSWLVRAVAGLVMIAALVAALSGYASLAADLLSALSQSALLVGGALLLREVIGEGIRAFMTPGRRFYDALSRTTGLSPETGRRLTFW